ncbi:Hypothetical protein D9617_2g058500 [Elsinoe fawcettii]|nr:Hypothetical protein D9617_2g058500 [Elsinoe fawcettii]
MATSSIDDRYLYLGLGLTLLLSTRLISHALTRTATLNLISPSSSSNPTHPFPPTDPDPTPSLHITSLSTLATSPNPDLSRSATLLLLERLAQSPAQTRSYIDDLFSPCAATRQKGRYLDELFALPAYSFRAAENPASEWRGLLDVSLELETPAARTVRGAYKLARGLEGKGRVAVMGRLKGLAARLETGSRAVLICEGMREGQVVAWIEVMKGLVTRGTDVGRIAKAARLIREAGEMEGLDAEEVWELLRGEWEAGLRREKVTWETEIGWGGIDGDGDNLPLSRAGRRPRFHEDEPEMADLRRRRREAMVLHEGDGMVHRDDIIEA